VLGSWAVKPGTKTFTGRALANVAGLFTLRVQFMRNGKLIPRDYSGSAQLKVLGVKVAKAGKPNGARASAAVTADGVVVYPSWTNVVCASFDTLGHGVDLPSPWTSAIPGQVYVQQLLYTATWQPATQSWGPWQQVYVPVQEITQPQQDVIPVGPDFGVSGTASNQLSPMIADFTGQPDEYHTFAWNVEAFVNGSWQIASATWAMPASYQQWPPLASAIEPSTSAYCETYANQT